MAQRSGWAGKSELFSSSETNRNRKCKLSRRGCSNPCTVCYSITSWIVVTVSIHSATAVISGFPHYSTSEIHVRLLNGLCLFRCSPLWARFPINSKSSVDKSNKGEIWFCLLHNLRPLNISITSQSNGRWTISIIFFLGIVFDIWCAITVVNAGFCNFVTCNLYEFCLNCCSLSSVNRNELWDAGLTFADRSGRRRRVWWA